MMQPIDPWSQLAMCCGLGGGSRRRGFKSSRSYFYSPSTAYIDPGNSWTAANLANTTNFIPHPQPQPYLLLTQPVIIAGNPAPNQTMTLVQHAQSTPNASGQQQQTLAGISIIGTNQPQPLMNAAQSLMVGQQQQPNIVSSQYAIYNSPARVGPTRGGVSGGGIYDTQPNNCLEIEGKHFPGQQSKSQMQLTIPSNPKATAERKVVTLSSDVFKQLELIERQYDLRRDMELVERYGIVITRAVDPYSLMPHLTEATLRRYHTHFLFSNDYVIRFIEIIKRPGQTLGLYIRTVHFEDIRSRGSREGLVITKIDTDSPIYSSQVLHVGDEILSVNLVDIQGMSLDDVVIIMSIPKRLVLALRIPRDRDQLLSLNLMQQQQQVIRNSIEHQGALMQHSAALAGYQQQHQIRSGLAPFRDDQNLTGDISIRQQTVYGGREPAGMSSTSKQLNEVVRREMSHQALHDSNVALDRDLFHARPIRINSALEMNDILATSLANESLPTSSQLRHLEAPDYESNCFPRRYNSIGHWPSSLQQQQNNSRYEPISMREDTGRNLTPTMMDEKRLFERHSATTKAIDDIERELGHQAEFHDHRFVSSYERSSELPEHRAGQAGLTNRGSYSVANETYSGDQLLRQNQDLSSTGVLTSETLQPMRPTSLSNTTTLHPRRTLPTRPSDLESSSPPISTSANNNINNNDNDNSNKQQPSVLTNLRLGDTPEQSSYFSSSIDAINRELKELRRQRMALSSGNGSNDDQQQKQQQVDSGSGVVADL